MRKKVPFKAGRDANAFIEFFGVALVANFAKFLACGPIERVWSRSLDSIDAPQNLNLNLR